ncbi:MAG TPA: tetratricopeptide repeat protein [Bacteroidota bacterium]|nr:tetratricopeptide repeat protein [Bacteroidota bacterium]
MSPLLTVRAAVLAALLLLCAAAPAAGPLRAQEKNDSPVFKKYHPPPPPPLVESSDALYQMWQTFIVTRKANAGDVLAQHELSIRYLLGRGAAADTVRAAYWMRRASDAGYTPAMFNYAIMCYNGWGVPWDPFEAYRLFRATALKKMPEAEYAMAQFMTEDLVVPRNYDSAYAWVRKSADAGYAPAKEALARLEREGIGPGHADSAKQAQPRAPNTGLVFLDFPQSEEPVSGDSLLLREAIQNASPSLRKALGVSKLLDSEAPADSTTVAALLRAGDAGSPEALTVLARSYERGIGVTRDPVKACALYVRAIRLDSPRAPELLMKLLEEKNTLPHIKAEAGKGDPVAEFAWAGLSALGFDGALAQAQVYLSGDEAFRLLEKSGERGYTPAIVEEGLAYYAGRWVPRNVEQAMELWTHAASLGSKDAMVRIALTTLRAPADTSGRREAVGILEKASEEGSVLAEVGLGYCYETGTGLPRKDAEAAFYYRAASMRGSQDAFRALRRMHDAIRPEDPEFKIPD